LLYLEWLLLGFTTLISILTAPIDPFPEFSCLVILSIAGFSIMGIRLPTGRQLYKVLYTVLEFGIILLPTILDTRIRFVPLLGLVAVIRSCRMFQLPGRLIVAGLAFTSFLFTQFLRSQATGFLIKSMEQSTPAQQMQFNSSNVLILKLTSSFLFALALVFVLMLINALLAEQQSRRELAEAHEQLRQYALRIEDQATLQERNRIAREIHDSLGHSLTAQSIQLENALMLLQSNVEKAGMFLIEAKCLGTLALKDVRQSVSALRSNPLQGQSLEAAIAVLMNHFDETTGIALDYTVKLIHPLTVEISTNIYRILQEALTNVSKHSAATQVTICLQEKDKVLSLLIEDNGNGFNPEQNTTGFGLQGIRERTYALNGWFKIVSKPGAGCRIKVYVPLARV
jgi:signal transduction histidine kinase